MCINLFQQELKNKKWSCFIYESPAKPELLLIDEQGRVNLHRTKTLILGIYVPNEDKIQFFQRFFL